MPKAKSVKKFVYPQTVYVQRVVDGDDSYLVTYTSVDDIDLDNGNVVAVYELGRMVNVIPGERILEEQS
jgi:hypothetical protein